MKRIGVVLGMAFILAMGVGAQEAPVSSPMVMVTNPGGFPVQLLMRWIHVLTAVVLAGGVVFMRFVLMPAAKATLDDAAHQRLRGAIIPKWRKIVHTGILLFLISGLYNYLFVTRFKHADSMYHMMFGIKFLLALVVFVLAVLLTSQKGYAERFRANAPFWMGVLVTVAVVVVLLGGYMKVMN
ncbi:MAG: hypothetical protein HYV26_24095 [Candidatus Hydrogenedentes bacterium]|nr:hypothetical protein [Candidatus Hydrogenedentota bacterium]